MIDAAKSRADLPPFDPAPQTDRPTFYVRRGDRLIARVKHMLYAARFARQCNGLVAMVWPDPPPSWAIFDGPDYHPGHIFDLERFRAEGGSEWLIFLPGSTPWPKDGVNLRMPAYAPYRNNRFDRALFTEPGLVFHDGSLMQYHFKGEDPRRPALDAELRTLFAAIPRQPIITDTIDRIRNELQGIDYASVHFRAGDVYHMLQEGLPLMLDGGLSDERLVLLMGHFIGRTSPVEIYDRHVRRLIDEGRKILFASDTPAFIEVFRKRYGADSFVDLARFDAPVPIQKAMIDFCALAGGKTIYGSRSNYGSLAAALGGAELVTVSATGVTDLSPEAVIDLYYRTAVDSFLGGSAPPAPVEAELRAEIRRHYLFVNRIGSKEEVAALDPRKR